MNKRLIEPKKNVASFDVDAQNAFTPLCPDELPVPDGEKVFAELNLQARYADYRIGSKEAHHPKAYWVANQDNPVLSPIIGNNMDVRWPVHAVPGTLGFELIAGLPKVTEYHYFVWKGVELDLHPYGSCFHDHHEKLSTGVIEFLHSRKISTLIVGGLATDYCVKVTVLQLLKAGFKVIVNLGACRGLHPETTKQAIHEMTQRGAVFIDSAAQLENMSV